jgi:ABC-2 type transport system ATP-binding protein
MLHLTRNLNRRFDVAYARARLAELGVTERQKAGKLSGGQHAQLALTLALARHPRLLVLDEPTAPLDPVARHDFMAAVMLAIADDGVSVLLSSHMLAELARVADYLVLLSHGRVRLEGPVEHLLATHRLVTGPPAAPVGAGWQVVESSTTSARTHRLVRLTEPDSIPPDHESRAVGLEELALAYLRQGPAPTPALAEVLR